MPTDDGSKPLDDPEAAESVFIFCVIWSIGGALVQASREKFDAFVKQLRYAWAGVRDKPVRNSLGIFRFWQT